MYIPIDWSNLNLFGTGVPRAPEKLAQFRPVAPSAANARHCTRKGSGNSP